MQNKGKSLESQIRQAIDDKEEIQLKPHEQVTYEQELAVEQRFEGWLITLKRRYPTSSERYLKELAARLACQNRKERRRQFKQSSPKTPQLMKVPKGKR